MERVGERRRARARGRGQLAALLVGAAAALGAASALQAQELPVAVDPGEIRSRMQGPEAWDPQAPVDIRSRRMHVDFDAQRIVFEGEVHVTQADFRLTADRITATFGEDAQDIQRIVASGNVTVQKGDKSAWGEAAVYDRHEASIVLDGEPVIRQGNNHIRGSRIQLFLDEDRMEVEGDVEAAFRIGEERGTGDDAASAGDGTDAPLDR